MKSLLDKFIKTKSIKTSYDSQRDLYLFKYQNLSVDWNQEVYRLARGIVLDSKSRIILQPYSKFFNHNQLQSDYKTYDSSTLKLSKWQNSPISSITEKIDGSLVTFAYRKGYGLIVSSSDSLNKESLIIEETTEFLKEHQIIDKLKKHPEWTLIGEFYSLDNELAYHYSDKPQLWLHGARTHWNGTLNDPLVSYQELQEIGKELGIRVVKQYTFQDLKHIQDFLKNSKGVEGVVVTFKNGIKLKLKSDEYLSLRFEIDLMFDGITKNKVMKLVKLKEKNELDDLIVKRDSIKTVVSSIDEFTNKIQEQINKDQTIVNHMKNDSKFRVKMFKNNQVSQIERMLLKGCPNNQIIEQVIKKNMKQVIKTIQERMK